MIGRDVLVVRNTKRCSRELYQYVMCHEVTNEAGDRFTFTSRSHDSWHAHKAAICEIFLIDMSQAIGTRKKRHTYITTDDHDKIGLVTLNLTSEIWKMDHSRFQRYALFKNIRRGSDIVVDGPSRNVVPKPCPPELDGHVAHHTSFGSTAVDDHAATLLKIAYS